MYTIHGASDTTISPAGKVSYPSAAAAAASSLSLSRPVDEPIAMHFVAQRVYTHREERRVSHERATADTDDRALSL